MPTLEDAIILAAEAHRGQVDKSGRPYVLHVMRVVLRMETEEEQIVAALHDVIEDTELGWWEVAKSIGYDEADTVVILTRKDGENYADYIARCATCSLARAVKMADLQDHLDNAEGVLDESQRKRYRQALNYLLDVDVSR